jgi:hypothetical protein
MADPTKVLLIFLPPLKVDTTVTYRVHIRGFISISGASLSYPRPSFKAYYLSRTFSRLIKECDDKLSIKEF